MRCLAVCQDELVIRMLDEILLPGFEVEFIVESRPLARRLHDAGVNGHRRRSPPHRHLPQGRPRPRAPASSSRTTAAAACKKILEAVRDAGGDARLRARHRHGGRPRERAEELRARVPRRRLPVDVGAVRRPAAHRVQPVADARAGPAVPALLQRRRPRPDPAAQRSGSRRDGQRPGAAQRPAPDEDDGHHRRAAGRDAAREPADGQPARHPGRGDHAGSRSGSSTASRWSTCSRTTSAA